MDAAPRLAVVARQRNTRSVLTWLRSVVSWRWYGTVVLGTWVLAPEARRIFDWFTAFHAVSPLIVLPLGVMVPAVLVAVSSWQRIGTTYRRVGTLWLLAFSYAFVVSYLSGSVFSAAYDFANYIVLLLLGIVLAAPGDENVEVAYTRTANALLWLAAITSLYGIYQYISPPPWDVYWAQQANVENGQGITAAFNFRIFGTLNSTGPLSGFLAFAILLNAPRLRPARWWVGLLMVPSLIALILTSVRAEWLALAAGLAIFAFLSPKRGPVLVTLGGVAAVFVLAGSILLTVVSAEGANSTLNTLGTRISTFGSVTEDASALSREDQTAEGISEGMAEPLGQGLGASGNSTKLAGGTGGAIDNGFVSRFFEMGYVGFVIYETALLIAIIATFRTYRRFLTGRNFRGANILAVAVATQIVLFISEVDADQHAGTQALFFWFALFIASGFAAPSGLRVKALGIREPVVLTPARGLVPAGDLLSPSP